MPYRIVDNDSQQMAIAEGLIEKHKRDHEDEMNGLRKQIYDLKQQKAKAEADRQEHEGKAALHGRNAERASTELTALRTEFDDFRRLHAHCESQLSAAKATHAQDVERLRREHGAAVEAIKGQRGSNTTALQNRIELLETQLTAKDTQHRLDIKKIETEKEKIAKAAAEAMAQHEQKMQAHDEHTISAQTYQRVIATKNEEIKRLEGEIVRLKAQLEEKDLRIHELRIQNARLPIAKGVLAGAFQKKIEEDHREALANQKKEHDELISTLMEVHNGPQHAATNPQPPPGGRRGWGISNLFARPKSQTPYDEETAKREYRNMIVKAHQPIPYKKDAGEGAITIRNNQIFDIADKKFSEKYKGVDPTNFEIGDDLQKQYKIKRPASYRFAYGATKEQYDSRVTATLQHFTFNNNNDISSGEGGLYIARSR